MIKRRAVRDRAAEVVVTQIQVADVLRRRQRFRYCASQIIVRQINGGKISFRAEHIG